MVTLSYLRTKWLFQVKNIGNAEGMGINTMKLDINYKYFFNLILILIVDNIKI